MGDKVLDLRRLRYFVAVAEELHFGRAAYRLGISQPPLSQQIQSLEDEFGILLFDRSRRRVQLTAAGELLLAESKKVVEQYARMESVVRKAASGELGHVSVAGVPSAFHRLAPALIREVRRVHPGLKLSLKEAHTAEIAASVLTGDVDVGIVWDNEVTAPTSIKVLSRQPFLAALPHGHRLASKKGLALKDFNDENIMMFPRSVSPRYFDSMMFGFEIVGIKPRFDTVGNSLVSQLSYVAGNFGVAFVPEFLRSAGAECIDFFKVDFPNEPIPISLIWNEEKCSPQARAFVSAAETLV